MNSNRPMTPTVDAIRKISFEGNIIPQSWYANIRTEHGKVDLAGCAILADIVYWYRPTEYRNERTGKSRYERKFHGEKLQRSYDQQGKMLGLTKDQARDALNRLCDAGLIIITVEHGVHFGNGTVGSGVVYLEPVPNAIAEITYRIDEQDEEGDTQETIEISDELQGQEIYPPYPENLLTGGGEFSETYTETTTKTTQSIVSQGETVLDEEQETDDCDIGFVKPQLEKRVSHGEAKSRIAKVLSNPSLGQRENVSNAFKGEKSIKIELAKLIYCVQRQVSDCPLDFGINGSVEKKYMWGAGALLNDIKARNLTIEQVLQTKEYFLNGGGEYFRLPNSHPNPITTGEKIIDFFDEQNQTKLPSNMVNQRHSAFPNLPTLQEIEARDRERRERIEKEFS